MKLFLYLLILFQVCLSCTSKRPNEIRKFAIAVDEKKGDTTTKFLPKSSSYLLDSIEKANEESVRQSGINITKAHVFLKKGDSLIQLRADIRKDHRFFGFSKPDTKSERLLLFSVFTNDVETNPFGCKLGAYYDTYGMGELSLYFVSFTNGFIKAVAKNNDSTITTLYFERKWIEIE